MTGEYELPQMRINIYGYWEISNDGGKTWDNTGVAANGPNGKPDPVVLGVTEEKDKVILTVMIDGKIVILAVPKTTPVNEITG